MEKQQFIDEIAKAVVKYAAAFDIACVSAVIGQACLESNYGTSYKANFNNYFGLKYRPNRCPSASGTFEDRSKEQNPDGTYREIVTTWFKFDSIESGVKGYFEFTNKYERLKKVTDPREYLEIIKSYGYASSINYVTNVMQRVTDNNLQEYDKLLTKEKEGNKMGYTNSSLVSHVNISPNRNSPRNHEIDTITIHCVVGQVTVERLGQIFAPVSRQASSNYGIGYDGRVGLYCPESDRSWCSSSASNDNRAITIEVASDTTHPYAVTDAAYNALIELCADICRRNNIKELKWQGDKSLIGQADKQNMTVHRWFAAKACPGDYLYNRHADIAAKVNEKLGVSSSVTVKPAEVAPVPQNTVAVSESDNEKKIWDFLKSKNLNDYAVAGAMGNLYAESGLRANNLQNTYETKFGLSDEEYTKRVDAGVYGNFVRDSAGYGLAQWTYWSRKQNLYNYAKAAGKSIGDLDMQLSFLWQELQGYAGVMHILRNAKSVLEASNAILTQYEKPADQSFSVQKRRADFGEVYYKKYAVKTTQNATSDTSELYRVRLSWNDPKSQLGAYKILENAKKACKEGYTVYDKAGNEIYTKKTGRLYKVKKGDSYWKIAAEQLWDGTRYKDIMNLNNSAALHPDMVIALPEK